VTEGLPGYGLRDSSRSRFIIGPGALSQGAIVRTGTSEKSQPEVTPIFDEPIQLLTPEGVRIESPEYDSWVEDVEPADLLAMYEDMVVVRRFDNEATALQRQGQLGLWPPALGQEAAQIGSARALRKDDFAFTSYRDHGVAYVRGVALEDMTKVWRGTANSGWDPFSVNVATPAVIIGAQTLHATGYAMGCQRDGVDSVAVAYFGDGATSQGDVNEAMIFAASFKAPVIFFCQNNQWAISEPVGVQAIRPIADRAPGFGIPSLRVDGNDALAVMAAMRVALERARSGGGATFIEAVTYRMGPHTTSDDPSRYEDLGDREEWSAKDPITRFELYLDALGLLTDSVRVRVKAAADDAAKRFRAACIALQDPAPMSVFDNVYAEPHSGLERQKREFAAYLSYIEGQPVSNDSSR
jgi:2-oxoisovalerate dehydrogenase E1 component alpha subunit